MEPWILAAVALAALLVAGVSTLKRWNQVRAHLAGIAEGRHPRMLAPHGPDWFRDTARDLNRISELLAARGRQAAAEGDNLRAILGAMVEGVLITDASQRVRVVNGALIRMFDLSTPPSDRTVMEVFRSHDLHAAVSDALAQREPQTRVMRIETGTGSTYSTHDFEVSISPLVPDSGTRAEGVIAVFHDITELKTQERLRQELVANVSHELRTPLSIVHGYVETLLDGAIEDRPTAERFLKVMHRHGERLNLIIEDLLTLSRLDSGTTPLALEPVDLRESITTVLDRLESNIRTRATTVTTRFTDDFPTISADPHRIDQLLFNLLDNALKYTPAESGTIAIEGSHDANGVEIRITDNGPGIPLEDQPRLFERFYRVHKHRNRDAGGTGLGLSIVKHIVAAHGGEVGLRSIPGQGATFWFRLPGTPRDPA